MGRINVVDSTYQRDLESRGLVETDTRKRDDYNSRRKMLNMTKNQKDEINTLKAEMADLKESIRDLVELVKGKK